MSGIGNVFETWWRDLQGADWEVPPGSREDKPGRKSDQRKPDRASLARLRRIGFDDRSDPPRVDLVKAMTIVPFRILLQRLKGLQPASGSLSRYANDRFMDFAVVAASTLARIREDTGGGSSTASLLGGDEPLMAEARFKRLIRTRDPAELLDQGRRIAALLEGKAPVADLGTSLLLWEAGPGVVRRWTVDYYGGLDEPADDAADATPGAAGLAA